MPISVERAFYVNFHPVVTITIEIPVAAHCYNQVVRHHHCETKYDDDGVDVVLLVEGMDGS